jgi:hypothetical protein
MTADGARAIALSFEGAVEQDHHGRPSFRVGGKIFATLWTDDQLNVMLPDDRIEQVAAEEPERCEPGAGRGVAAALSWVGRPA